MKHLRIALLLVVVVAAFGACKKGSGGYLRTAPQPASLQ